MNRSNILIGMLCGLLAAGSIQAAWYSPMVRYIVAIKAKVLKHPKIAASFLAVGVLSYLVFDKIRDHKINKEKRAILEKDIADARQCIGALAYYSNNSSSMPYRKTWCKKWQPWVVHVQSENGQGVIEVKNSDGNVMRTIHVQNDEPPVYKTIHLPQPLQRDIV